MEKYKTYVNVRFSVEAVREAYQKFIVRFDNEQPLIPDLFLMVKLHEEEWYLDSIEDFFVEYRKSSTKAVFQVRITDEYLSMIRVQVVLRRNAIESLVSVSGPDRRSIEKVFDIFEKYAAGCTVQPPSAPSAPKVFIGHGHNQQWRDLKDQLQDLHGYSVVAYETGARAGHAIRDVLEEMLENSDFAILVMTGEDGTGECWMNPRMNVVHELGLFQGRLGFGRAIVLLEEGTNEFSNINGVHQIRFGKGNIEGTFGEVLATLRREFPDWMPT